VVWVDTGISYQGYASDFGRTWIVSDAPRPSARQREQFARWQEVIGRVLGAVRAGATGADLTAAALAGAGQVPALSAGPGSTRPWLTHLYLAHGVGLDSAEAPLVGTDLGDEFDGSILLAPGMILVLEPVIWEEGHAGFRGEEIVAVTETGYEKLSNYPYWPYE
jgi:Xaa-Pro aminopeptidase